MSELRESLLLALPRAQDCATTVYERPVIKTSAARSQQRVLRALGTHYLDTQARLPLPVVARFRRHHAQSASFANKNIFNVITVYAMNDDRVIPRRKIAQRVRELYAT